MKDKADLAIIHPPDSLEQILKTVNSLSSLSWPTSLGPSQPLFSGIALNRASSSQP